MEQKVERVLQPQKNYDYEKIAASPEFKSLIRKKNKFLLPVTIFFLLFYFSLPLLTSFSTVLNKPAVGDISWVWVLALAQFIMTWTLCMVYVKKANGFDADAESIVNRHNDTKGSDRP
ncbi:DUF485 domain-containing protein [Domibacillus sp. 8LH]|uniref:DUF485 domain-containing protein n=1 Tax=Domibacillus TaxID=1433999 RepID=UPI001F5A3A0D|nr:MULTISPECIES: DUF485 domain-containing protein [Domibacillus]MCI2254063.1 DUF485 domain-containing protein [Domibacillus sp. PGB-M46]MCM3789522.1 DUF485 domain-containing protein [Domibacillus indicus]